MSKHIRKRKPKADDLVGVLLEPVRYYGKAGVLGFSQEEINEQIGKQYIERISALFEYFNIAPPPEGIISLNNLPYVNLVIRLAEKYHILGFRIKFPNVPIKGAGRPPEWESPKGIKLYADVSEIMKREKCSSVLKTIKDHLVRDKTSLFFKEKPKSLEQRYKDFKAFLGKDGCENLDFIIRCDHEDWLPIKALIINGEKIGLREDIFGQELLDALKRFSNLLRMLPCSKIA